MITEKGQAYFLNRLINNQAPPIDSVVLGTGNKVPSKTDTSLVNKTLTKSCQSKVDIRNKRVILSVDLTPSELKNIHEIGAVANGELLTRDLIENAPTNITSNINLEYIIELDVTNVKTEWAQYSGNIYYTHQPDRVKGVTETNSENGYHRAPNISSMENGSYLYEHSKELLYIKTSDGTNPNSKSIQVIIR